MNSRIRPVALFAQVVDLDGMGRGTARFELPPYEGRLRAMVVVAGPRVVGATARSVVVKAPLSLQIATPRMLAPGDRVVVPVTLKNNTQADGTVELRIEPGPGVQLADGYRVENLPLRAGRGRTVDVPLVMGAADAVAGPRWLRIAATMGDQRSDVMGEFLVRSAALFTREERGLRLEGEQEIAFGEGWVDGEVKVKLQVDHQPAMHLRGALQSLLDYPHGCLEQTTSRAMGLLSCHAMLPRMLGANAPEVMPMLQAGVDRIFTMQCSSGGFAWWPGGRATYEFGTVHAIDFLLAAKALGASLPEASMRHAVDALARIVARSKRVSLRCHAIEVLSRAGRPVQPWLDFLAAAAVLPDDRARIALALACTGHETRARAMFEHREYDVRRSSRPMLRSKVRDKALELRARLQIDEVDARALALVRYLDRVMARPARFTTQEKAQALRALAAYYTVLPQRSAGERLAVTVRQGDNKWELRRTGVLELTADPKKPLRITTVGPVFGALTIAGQRRVERELRSQDVGLKASIRDLSTGAIADRFVRGRLYEITVQCEAPEGIENFLITQLLPGGFEIDPPRPNHSRRRVSNTRCHIERRDDRVLVFVPGAVRGRAEFRYRVRAVFPGRYHAPPLRLEAMYDPDLRVSTAMTPPVEVHAR